MNGLVVNISDENYTHLKALAENSGETIDEALNAALELYFYRPEIVECENCKAPVADRARLNLETDSLTVVCKKCGHETKTSL